MYLGIDVGGTKTLVASLTNEGVITETFKFPTPKTYAHFVLELRHGLANLKTQDFKAVGIAIPGRVDRKHGTGIGFGNLPWKNVAVETTIQRIVHAPVIVENDANAAALSEAMLLNHKHNVVLYVTIGTGIGTGLITNGQIDPEHKDMEGGLMLLEHKGKLMEWEEFASGHAIYKQFGKKASEITSDHDWKIISRNLAFGMINLIAITQPDVIVLGGGIGTSYPKYKKHLQEILKKYETPLTPIPPIVEAQRPEEAVVYGCYDLAKQTYGHLT